MVFARSETFMRGDNSFCAIGTIYARW